MRAIPRRLTFSLLLALLSCAPALAQETRMQLLTPNMGWVSGADKLYWTTDGGGHWTNIAPPMSVPNEKIGDVFFKDTTDGWVLLSRWDQAEDNWRFDLAETADSGSSWSSTPLAYPDLTPELRDAMAGLGSMYFVDRLHGWMVMGLAGNSRPGKLLATQDGGRTWNWVNSPGVAGAIRFITAQDGWLAGGMDPKLYVTHDGCKSWQEVALKPPPQVGAATEPTYHLPVFDGSERGFLPVNYSGREGTPSKLVVYATDDLGRTWRPDRVLADSRETTVGQIVPLAIADSVLVVSTGSSPTSVSVAAVPLRGEAGASVVASPIGVLALSFADSAHGWVLSAHGNLLSTADGGATWAEVTPWRQTKPGRISEAPGPPGGAAAAGPSNLHLYCSRGDRQWWRRGRDQHPHEPPPWVRQISRLAFGRHANLVELQPLLQRRHRAAEASHARFAHPISRVHKLMMHGSRQRSGLRLRASSCRGFLGLLSWRVPARYQNWSSPRRAIASQRLFEAT